MWGRGWFGRERPFYCSSVPQVERALPTSSLMSEILICELRKAFA